MTKEATNPSRASLLLLWRQRGYQSCEKCIVQGGHKPEKPGMLRDFSEHGKLREFCATSGKNCNKQSIFSLLFKYLCKNSIVMTLDEDHYYIYFLLR